MQAIIIETKSQNEAKQKVISSHVSHLHSKSSMGSHNTVSPPLLKYLSTRADDARTVGTR